MKIKTDVLISSLTTMRIGGPAKFVIEIEKLEDILPSIEFAESKNLPIFILGGGANTIGYDEGYNGVILLNRIKGIEFNGDNVRAMGGEVWDELVAVACEKGLTGIEALSRIPGTVGAAPVQNIGAYGQEVADTLASVEVFDLKKKVFTILNKKSLGFAYRKSILNTAEQGRYFVVAINLQLKKGMMKRPFYKSIEQYIEANKVTDFSPMSIRQIVSKIRADKLPDPKMIASSGSFFKNIYLDKAGVKTAEAKGLKVYHGADGDKINSGYLIELAGLAGELIDGMRVNKKAALVLINESANSYQNLSKAREKIVKIIFEKFGYILEQEPVEIK